MSAVRTILEFYDAPAAASFNLPPAAAMSYFKAKGLKTTFDWRDMLGAEHANAFTIAKMADLDLLADIQASLDDAISQGLSFRSWADTITPILQSKGWWGRQAVTDPLTGETIVAQLGSPGRLKTIFRTNVQSAYAVGQWEEIQSSAEIAPYLLYDAVDDHRTRPEHKAWDNTVLPVGHPWWKAHYPPNGWNCRCGVIQLSEDDLEDLGLAPNTKAPGGGSYEWKNPRTGKAEKVPQGLDPGWNVNQGEIRLQHLQNLAAEKLKKLKPQDAIAGAKGIKAAEKQAQMAAIDAGISAAPAMEATAAQLAKGAGKAQIRAAEQAIAKAVKENTPYLAKALDKIKASKAGKAMGPVELLDAAKAEAVKVKDAAALANWKAAQIQGKPGNAAGQAVFDALPEAAQTSILDDIAAKSGAKAAQEAIETELKAMAAGDLGPMAKANLAEIQTKHPELSGADLLAKVKTMPAQLTKGQQSGGLNGWIKNAVAGKPPTPKQQLAFDMLTDAQKAKQLAKVDAIKAAKAKAKAAAAGAPDPQGPELVSDAVPDINPGQMVQIGPQKGSNPGGTYVDKATGTEWYVKFPASADNARNEVLAAKLYEAAGIDVPDLRLVTIDGKTAVASRIEAGLTKGTADALAKGGAFDGFAVDAWLGNWDVAGATMDNMLMRGARVFRVDTGGALRYRAQGTLKGSAWGDTVPEIQSLRNPGTAPQAAQVFGKMTDADIEASVKRVLAVRDRDIDDLLDRYGPEDLAERKALADRLKARRDDLARQFPNASPAKPVLPDNPDTERVTAMEQYEVEASRVNGYTFRTDGDQIEQQQVVVSVIEDASGGKVTRMFLKVREPGARGIEAKMADKNSATRIDIEDVRQQMVAVLKSINSRADKGEMLGTVPAGKMQTLKTMWSARKAQIQAAALENNAEAMAMIKDIDSTIASIDGYLVRFAPAKTPPGYGMVDVSKFRDVALKQPKTKADTLAWRRTSGAEYDLAQFTKSRAKLTGQKQRLPGVGEAHVLDGGDYTVTYIPEAPGNSVSSRGVVMIDIDGDGITATGKGFKILERIGVKATRSSTAERMELYLDNIAYQRTLRNDTLAKAYEAAGKIADPQARANAKLQLLNADAGRDITKSRYWNPDGEHQAFGHGRTLLLRPDLDDVEVAKFSKEYVVYSNTSGLSVGSSAQWSRVKQIIEGGGQLGSQVDRMRRGVASIGSSVDSDHRSGGANYIFTRLINRQTRGKDYGKAGVYWNPERLMRRTDAFSYDHDAFGSVDRSLQERARKIDPEGWRSNAANGGNETNFRDSLSIFDDLEKIVFLDRIEYETALKEMREMGYSTWPDGRKLEEVFSYEGRKP